MQTLIFFKKQINDEILKKAADLLNQSKIVAFPTETVYGIGAHIFKEDALEKIYKLKNRPKDKGLIVHLGKIQDVLKVACDIPDEFYLLAKYFFPGPLTLVLKKKKEISKLISNDKTIAVRMPDCKYTTRLIEYVKDPIVGTSANISDDKNPICIEDVISIFSNKIDAVIDGGECPIKKPSTILDLTITPYRILRQGSITKDELNNVLSSNKVLNT